MLPKYQQPHDVGVFGPIKTAYNAANESDIENVLIVDNLIQQSNGQ